MRMPVNRGKQTSDNAPFSGKENEENSRAAALSRRPLGAHATFYGVFMSVVSDRSGFGDCLHQRIACKGVACGYCPPGPCPLVGRAVGMGMNSRG